MSGELTFYTAAEVADLLRLNHQVVQRKLQAGEIPGYRLGREWRVEQGQLRNWLEEHSNQRRRNPADAWFEPDGKLKSLPGPRAKRDAVLQRIAQAFVPNTTYTEREVNVVLRRFHDDVATIRRELIITKQLVRTPKGIYKRTGPREAALKPGA